MPINADQNPAIDPKCLSMPIIANQSELIDIRINARIFIDIDRHWSAISRHSAPWDILPLKKWRGKMSQEGAKCPAMLEGQNDQAISASTWWGDLGSR